MKIAQWVGIVTASVCCVACQTSRYHQVIVKSSVDPVAFELALDGFLRSEGLRPVKEINQSNPQLLSDVTHGLPRWDKNFDFTFGAGSGFIAVQLAKPYNPIEMEIGGSDGRERDAERLLTDLKTWLRRSYPDMLFDEKTVPFTRFPF